MHPDIDQVLQIVVAIKRMRSHGVLNDKDTDVFIRTGQSIIDQHVFDMIRDEITTAGDIRSEVIAFNAVSHDTTLVQYDELITDMSGAADSYMQKRNKESGSLEQDREVALAEQAETEAKIKELGLWDEFERNKEAIRKRVAAKRMQVMEEAERKVDAGN